MDRNRQAHVGVDVGGERIEGQRELHKFHGKSREGLPRRVTPHVAAKPITLVA